MLGIEKLSKQQQKILMIGVPAVAAFALISQMQKKASSGVISGGTYTDTGEAIGIGQLSSFETSVSDTLAALANQVASGNDRLAGLENTAAGLLAAQQATISPQTISTTSPSTASTQHVLPQLVASAFLPEAIPGTVIAIGAINAPGSYEGKNVSNGAPIYAAVDGRWLQNQDLKNLPVGTPIGTLAGLENYIVQEHVVEAI